MGIRDNKVKFIGKGYGHHAAAAAASADTCSKIRSGTDPAFLLIPIPKGCMIMNKQEICISTNRKSVSLRTGSVCYGR